MPVVVEIVARFGDTVIDHVDVGPGAHYRLADRSFIAAPGTYEVGLVAIQMTRTFRVEQPVPRRAIAWRPIVYACVSLLAHVALVVFALLSEPFERMTGRIESRPRYFTRIEEPPPPAATVERVNKQTSEPGKRRTKRQARSRATTYTAETVAAAFDKAIANVAASSRVGNLDDVGPRYNEDDATAKGFGGHLWDIDNDPDFATIKTGEGYDTSGLADTASLYGLSPVEKTKRRFELQTALAHKSAIRGDCFPAHRIAKWLDKLDKKLFKSMYLADPDIVACLRQEIDPRVQWRGDLSK